MTLFYDPLKKKPKIWPIIVFIIIPILLIFFGLTFGKSFSEKIGQSQESQAEEDIFKKF